ncbi:MAG TPA: SigB/SigF/SigG family RNA polymerase sigma factor [Solirubrobacteraceae bacterium]|jgi:RNA polymerase sigma-B factor|nr:SigB/SigF/SigG family RNA polymerase sigma factor [Solirubrobacteraceae bacterium]
MTTTTIAAPRQDRSGAGATDRPRGGERDRRELERLWRNRNDEASRAALAARFMPLARSLARRYERSSESLDDLLQVASLGLLKAIDRFDPARGNAFVSFAVPTILGELRRYFRDCCWDVHVPRGTQERTLKLEEAQRRLTLDRGRAPSVAELAEYLEIDSEQVLDAMAASQAYGALSLDAPRTSMTGEPATTYAELLGDTDERYELVEDCVTIGRALEHIPERERLVLQLRFVEDLTQSEIAERIGVSQMQVSRLLRHALEQLRILTRASEPDDA